MKKNPGRASRRRLAKQNRAEHSAKKQAVNERKLLHWAHSIGEFQKQPRFLSALTNHSEEEMQS